MQNELTGPKLSFTRSRRHDKLGEPIESTHTLEIVLQNSPRSWKKSDTDQLKKSTLINSHYMPPSAYRPSRFPLGSGLGLGLENISGLEIFLGHRSQACLAVRSLFLRQLTEKGLRAVLVIRDLQPNTPLLWAVYVFNVCMNIWKGIRGNVCTRQYSRGSAAQAT